MAIFLFLFFLATGLLGALAVVRLGAEGRQFFLWNGGLAMILGTVALTIRTLAPDRFGWGLELRPEPAFVWLAAAGLLVLAIYLLLGSLGRERRWLLRAAALLVAGALVKDAIDLHSGAASGPLPAGTLLHVLNAATSAWLAGSVLLAMILGHFYLVIPSLSIAPLRALFRWSLGGLAARVALVALAGALWWTHADGATTLTVAVFLGTGVFVLQRLLFGLLIPCSLAYFTWKTIEMRSTQSATGILYVVVFLTLVGEALSVYLSLATRIPF